MGVELAIWESRLLSLAHEALTSPTVDAHIRVEADALATAYAYCARITRTNSNTFYMASQFLPKHKRIAVQALYAFCRCTDDLVDETQGLAHADKVFSNWRARLNNSYLAAHDPVPLAWMDTQTRYQIPKGYADQLIAGVARDLTPKRYESFADLAEYCYGVASTVGLMSMHIIGFESQAALPYAVKLGIALQLTNILRDVGEDWQAGRLYLPLDELNMFGLDESDIADGQVDNRWRDFMKFQINRVHHLYEEAQPGIRLLNTEGRFAIAAAANLYRAILDDIETHDYDVFHRRAHIGLWGKASRLPGIWWNSRANNLNHPTYPNYRDI
ncbi:MAG: squalene/phytoene synthase family protein [Anaerolineae bacterium]|nr:squalene/phytoene synthase family protein [Anaerolineae bacterium]